MIKPTQTLTILAALCFAGVTAMAQPAVKIVTVDVVRAYNSFWEVKQNEQKLRAKQATAKEVFDGLEKERKMLIEEFDTAREKAANDMLTEDARQQARTDAEQKYAQIQQKTEEINQYLQNKQRELQTSEANQREIIVEKIERVALQINEAKGGTILLDKSGATHVGLPAVMYADPGFDITDEVITELNKTKPADFKETEEGS